MDNVKTFLTTLLIIICTLSCKTKKQGIDSDLLKITEKVTQCGSYEIKNTQKTIGYVVKPFYTKVDKVKEITDFELKFKSKYGAKYKNRYRVYTFTKDRIGDTIINVFFLSTKHTQKIPNWKCEQQDVDTYCLKYNNRKAKCPHVISYNCSKNRFKISGDPD